jgi:hypothetical protein
VEKEVDREKRGINRSRIEKGENRQQRRRKRERGE